MRLDIGETNLESGELVAADAPTQNLVESCFRVELPLAAPVDERNREGPVVVADDQGLCAVTFAFDRVLRVISRDELLPSALVGDRIARTHYGLSLRTEHSNNRLIISNLCGGDQSIDSSIRRLEPLLSERRCAPAQKCSAKGNEACFCQHGKSVLARWCQTHNYHGGEEEFAPLRATHSFQVMNFTPIRS